MFILNQFLLYIESDPRLHPSLRDAHVLRKRTEIQEARRRDEEYFADKEMPKSRHMNTDFDKAPTCLPLSLIWETTKGERLL